MAPQAKDNETPNKTKWDNPSNTDVNAAHDQEKHGKTRKIKADKEQQIR